MLSIEAAGLEAPALLGLLMPPQPLSTLKPRPSFSFQSLCSAILRAMILLATLMLPSATFGQDGEPTILVPTQYCPQYVELLRRYNISLSKKTGLLGCQKLYNERGYLLNGMLSFGQNLSCYDRGWDSSQVVAFLQDLINQNQSERAHCLAWLDSGRVCNDGSLCPAKTLCTNERICVASPRPAVGEREKRK